MKRKDNIDCEFCGMDAQEEAFISNEYFFAKWDKYPVSPGHAIIISKRHICFLAELRPMEATALFRLLKKSRKIIKDKYHPGGFNFGVNEGSTAGQTIFHLHIHLIPRYKGDVKDPRGGVRNVIPGKGKYPFPRQSRQK